MGEFRIRGESQTLPRNGGEFLGRVHLTRKNCDMCQGRVSKLSPKLGWNFEHILKLSPFFRGEFEALLCSRALLAL